MLVMFAATYPERTAALVLYGCYAKGSWAPDYPWASTDEQHETWVANLESNWGGPFDLEHGAPSVARDEAARSWFGAYLRYSASLTATKALSYQNLAVDVRGLLPAVRVRADAGCATSVKVFTLSSPSPTSDSRILDRRAADRDAINQIANGVEGSLEADDASAPGRRQAERGSCSRFPRTSTPAPSSCRLDRSPGHHARISPVRRSKQLW